MDRKYRRKPLNRQKIALFLADAALTIVLIVLVIRFFATRERVDRSKVTEDSFSPQTAENVSLDDSEIGGTIEKFNALTGQGVDPVAWLMCEGTTVDYPVVQNVDDEYYMTRNVYGERDSHGAVSLDSRNSDQLLDGQIILYGNAMADGTMFGSLVQYRDQSYYGAHPTMTLYTPFETYTIHIYSAHLTSPEMANYPTWFDSEVERQSFINMNLAKSFIAGESDVPDDATLITLVTNSDYTAGENSRFALRGYLTVD